MLNPIISMLAIIKYLEKPFLGKEFPERLLPEEKNRMENHG